MKYRNWIKPLVVLVAASSFAAEPAAMQRLYIAVVGGIVRTELDGSNLETLAVTIPHCVIEDLAVHQQTGLVYWIEACTINPSTRVFRSDSDGRSKTVLVELSSYRAISTLTVDEATDTVYYAVRLSSTGPGEIRSTDANGENGETIAAGLGIVFAIDVDRVARKIYWVEWRECCGGKIVRSELDGMNQEDLVTGLGRVVTMTLDVMGGKVYWADRTTLRIQRADLNNGMNMETLTEEEGPATPPNGLALDLESGKVYWANTSKIRRMNLDGSNVEDVLSLVAGRLAIGAVGSVGIEQQPWGHLKRLFR